MLMNSHSAYTLQVHLYIWNLQEMEDLQTLWKQVLLLRQHSADLALVLVTHLLTMHFQSDILQETSLTEKVLSYRMVRYHQLHLWMQGQSQLQQLTRASLQQLQIVMLNSQAQHITLTAIYMLTEYFTARE